MKVSGIKVEHINFNKNIKKDKNIKECLKFLPKDISYKDIFPQNDQIKVDFKLENSNSAFANSIRIALIEECEVKSLEVEKYDTNDDFIIYDYLVKRIEAIPINQEAQYKSKITINVINETRDMIVVKSKDIKIDGKYNNSKFFEDTYNIINLNPGKHLKLTMKVVSGIGKNDSNKFANIANIRYEPGNAPYDEFKDSGKSSLVSNPTTFNIGFTTFRNTSVKNIINRLYDSLSNRLEKFLKELDIPKQEKKITYTSDVLTIETQLDTYLFGFIEEYRSLPTLIARYCYELQPTIKFVTSSIKHPSSDIGYVKINHIEPINLMKDAIKKILKDLKTFKNAF